MHQAGDRQLAAAGAAADLVRRLEDGDLDALAGEHGRRRQPVRPRADDDRAGHGAGAGRRLEVTSQGKSQRSSSQGTRVTMSAIATSPSSSSPVAAS